MGRLSRGWPFFSATVVVAFFVAWLPHDHAEPFAKMRDAARIRHQVLVDQSIPNYLYGIQTVAHVVSFVGEPYLLHKLARRLRADPSLEEIAHSEPQVKTLINRNKLFDDASNLFTRLGINRELGDSGLPDNSRSAYGLMPRGFRSSPGIFCHLVSPVWVILRTDLFKPKPVGLIHCRRWSRTG